MAGVGLNQSVSRYSGRYGGTIGNTPGLNMPSARMAPRPTAAPAGDPATAGFAAGGLATTATATNRPSRIPQSLTNALRQTMTMPTGGFIPGGPASMPRNPSGAPAPRGGPTSTTRSGPAIPTRLPPGGQTTNTSGTDPNMQYLIDRIKQRTGDAPTQRAIDVSNSSLRDSASGLDSALTEDMARRGLVGSGVEAEQRGQMAEGLQRAMAKNSAEISLGRERDIDSMLMGSGAIFSAPGQMNLANRQLALQQYLGQGNMDLQRAGLDLQKYGIDRNAQAAQQSQNFQQQMALLNLMSNLWT